MSTRDNLIPRAEKYAANRGLALGKPLGFGFHGSVFASQCQTKVGATAVKIGRRWGDVQAILAALEGYGIFMVDVNPGNISFGD